MYDLKALPEELANYINWLGIDGIEVGLFLLGYLIGEIGTKQWKWTTNGTKPILNKINFQGMDDKKVLRLANEVFEKMVQYKLLNSFNEKIYAVMKSILDKERNCLSIPYANTYWILSGYSFSTWEAVRSSSQSNEQK